MFALVCPKWANAGNITTPRPRLHTQFPSFAYIICLALLWFFIFFWFLSCCCWHIFGVCFVPLAAIHNFHIIDFSKTDNCIIFGLAYNGTDAVVLYQKLPHTHRELGRSVTVLSSRVHMNQVVAIIFMRPHSVHSTAIPHTNNNNSRKGQISKYCGISKPVTGRQRRRWINWVCLFVVFVFGKYMDIFDCGVVGECISTVDFDTTKAE